MDNPLTQIAKKANGSAVTFAVFGLLVLEIIKVLLPVQQPDISPETDKLVTVIDHLRRSNDNYNAAQLQILREIRTLSEEQRDALAGGLRRQREYIETGQRLEEEIREHRREAKARRE